MIDLLLSPAVLVLTVGADLGGWTAGRVAGLAERGAAALTEVAETARFLQILSGACP